VSFRTAVRRVPKSDQKIETPRTAGISQMKSAVSEFL
jgi:hypothetical protein